MMLNNCPTATKICLSSFKLMVTAPVGLIFFKGSAYIVINLVMHPCVPFRSGAPRWAIFRNLKKKKLF